MRTILQAGFLGLLLATLCGCAGGDDEPPGAYGETCDTAHPCAETLVCSSGLCTAVCGDSAACQAGSTGNVCVGGRCYTSCIDTISCPSGLTCTMAGSTMGTCRP